MTVKLNILNTLTVYTINTNKYLQAYSEPSINNPYLQKQQTSTGLEMKRTGTLNSH